MCNIRISREEYKILLTENAELKYLTATQKVEIERIKKVDVRNLKKILVFKNGLWANW